MGKKKNKKGGANYWDEEFQADTPDDAAVTPAPAADPVEAEEEPEPQASQPAKKGKKKKNKKGGASYWDDGEFEADMGEESTSQADTPTATEEPEADDATAEPTDDQEEADNDEKPSDNASEGGHLLTKKQKAKLKKQREKEEKRLQAIQKKAQMEALEKERGDAPPDSKQAGKQNKDQDKQQEQGKQAPKKKAGISKGAAAAIRAMQEQREAEERAKEQAKIEAQRLKEEEEARLAEEEEIRKHQAAIRREKEKIRKLQKAQEAEEEQKKNNMMRLGVADPAMLEALKGDKKKVIYSNKKKKNKNQQQKQEQLEAEKKKAEEEAKAAAEKKAAEDAPAADNWEDLDSWEDALNEDEPEETKESEKADEAKPAEENKTQTQVTETEVAKTDNTPQEGMRSPICCILGHVDTGKTKLLDKIRRTNVQEGEAGGITQQIGATFFPMNKIQDQMRKLKAAAKLQIKVPGLLIIDTPGHESFTNLRSRGSSLCDIAILVIDIMHGLEPQTKESIELLRRKKTPFVIALNKVDRLYSWKSSNYGAFIESYKKQNKSIQAEFEKRWDESRLQLNELGLNVELYWKNKDIKNFVNVVPTSAHTGEGIPDLLSVVIQLTQKMMSAKLLYISSLQCTILEVKVVEGLGTTIDVILVNGVLHEGDKIVVCGMNGAIVTTVRALLTPQPMKEIRVKGQYVHHKTVHAAQGIKICAHDLEKAVAGSSMLVARKGDDVEELKDEVMQDLSSLQNMNKEERGVYVQASTLGSLEALLEFLKTSKIPVAGVNIGPVNKKDVMKAGVMLEHVKEYAVILAFDVKVSREIRDFAEASKVQIFTADIIYHLFDQFTDYMEKVKNSKRQAVAKDAVWPCKLKILNQYIIMKGGSQPIVLGVEVQEGVVKVGTPIVAVLKEMDSFVELGKVTSMEQNKKSLEEARHPTQLAIKIENEDGMNNKVYGRHFDETYDLYSLVSRKSIDALKANYFDELNKEKEDKILLLKLKKLFKID